MEQIILAQSEMINYGLKVISENEVIMIFGNSESQSVEELVKKASEKRKEIRVIVVDSGPEFYGRNVVKRLSRFGIKCQYTLISMVNFLMNQVTKVFLPASYVLCNGALVAPTGSSMIACVAHKNQIPVIVVCETYKFEDRVNLDQINHNRELVPQKFQDNYLRKRCQNKSQLEEIIKNN